MTDTYSVSLSALWVLDLDCCVLCLSEKSNYSTEMNKYGKNSKGRWKFCWFFCLFSLRITVQCNAVMLDLKDINYLLVLYMYMCSFVYVYVCEECVVYT